MRHYLVLNKEREVTKVSLSYAEAASYAVEVSGEVISVMAKRVLEALTTASQEYRCKPSLALVKQLKIKWVYGEYFEYKN